MSQTITRLALGRGVFSVNCYLIKTDLGFVLVDTGTRRQRAKLAGGLRAQGCEPGSLKLILITHGDFDHIGNAAHVRRTFSAPIAMHEGDAPMSASGDMFLGRKRPNRLVRALLSLVARLPEEDRFAPDVLIDEGSDLTGFGLPGAEVLLLRGHSAGSIALLLVGGSVLCGDVLENRKAPRLASIMDDLPAAEASVGRLKTRKVTTVFPGHGKPFELADLGAPDGRRNPSPAG
ncbi:MAG: MBL fold metallo-hydrolase [Actinobacteria bacterium]|nr:MBL fold metallo-hydrolase [Actinomycetota bacterium]